MRSTVRLAAAFALAFLFTPRSAPPARAQALPPHAFLLGAWTGGLFPAPSKITAVQCQAGPTVIFTRDVIMRASLTDVMYVQRVIESVRGTGGGIDFHFTAATKPTGAAAAGITPADLGFGCDDPDVLHVRRLTPDEITFPGCTSFPFPLVRCPTG